MISRITEISQAVSIDMSENSVCEDQNNNAPIVQTMSYRGHLFFNNSIDKISPSLVYNEAVCNLQGIARKKKQSVNDLILSLSKLRVFQRYVYSRKNICVSCWIFNLSMMTALISKIHRGILTTTTQL